MFKLSGKWDIEVSAKNFKSSIQRRLLIAGSLTKDGIYALTKNTKIVGVEGKQCVVTPQIYNPRSKIWSDEKDKTKMVFVPSTGIEIHDYLRESPVQSTAANDLVIRCKPYSELLKEPPRSKKTLDLSLPMGVFEAVPLPCAKPNGVSQKFDISTGNARWVMSNGLPAPMIAPNPAWVSKLPAQWICVTNDLIDANPVVDEAGADYDYELKILVPGNCSKPISAQLTGIAYADNRVQLFINGMTLTSASGNMQGFLESNGVQFTANLPVGLHTLKARVHNLGGPTGLLVNASISIS